MSSRTPVIAANWKMFKTTADADDFFDTFLPLLGEGPPAEVVVCPPYLSLERSVSRCAGLPVLVAAQNMHEEVEGAFTGEVSAPMLVAAGVDGVILGHSERRAMFAETDASLRRKVPAALAAGLMPILCCGESEDEREGGETETVLRAQLSEDLADVVPERLSDVVIAYEPVWAIGTGKTATPDMAEETIRFCRSVVAGIDEGAAEQIRILYGGSVKPENAAELLHRPEIDGALVGGASLEPEAFAAIVEASRG
jgi:triosephosphate isomerase